MRTLAWRRFLAAIFAARSARVKCFERELAAGPLLSCADAGCQAVSVVQVVGSVGRWRELRPDFFYRSPFRSRERFERVGDALRRGVVLPPLELYQLSFYQDGAPEQRRSEFYVLDGHHRVAMARRLGQEFVDAHVVEYKVAAPAGRADGAVDQPSNAAARVRMPQMLARPR